jgi:hypothetical protein
VNLLRIILLLVLSYYLIKLLIRLFFPYFFRQYVNRKTGGSGNRQDYTKQRHKKEGDVTIDYLTKKKKRISKDKGEYIDFKEVK